MGRLEQLVKVLSEFEPRLGRGLVVFRWRPVCLVCAYVCARACVRVLACAFDTRMRARECGCVRVQQAPTCASAAKTVVLART